MWCKCWITDTGGWLRSRDWTLKPDECEEIYPIVKMTMPSGTVFSGICIEGITPAGDSWRYLS